MDKRVFHEFVRSGDSLRIYEGGRLIFASSAGRLLPVLRYLDVCPDRGTVVFDRIVGNAAALLFVRAQFHEVWSPLGSQQAIRTLDEYGIEHRFTTIVPFIQRPDGEMCPMERLSLDKEPDEFYETIKAAIGENRKPGSKFRPATGEVSWGIDAIRASH